MLFFPVLCKKKHTINFCVHMAKWVFEKSSTFAAD